MTDLTDLANSIGKHLDAGEATTYLDAEVLAAYADNLGLDAEDVANWASEAEEAYQGDYADDADFAQNLADDLGLVNADAGWPAGYIDWEWAARDLMMDYFESDGHYFRNL